MFVHNEQKLMLVSHIINNKFNDNDDIQHDVKKLFVPCNAFIAQCNICLRFVKCVLFKTFVLVQYWVAEML